METINKQSNDVMNENIRLCYFMVKTNKGVGYICMALERPEKDSNSHTYRAGFSFCSPQEGKKFSKQKARLTALGRLASFGREDEHNRIEFESDAKNLNQVFKDGLIAAENFKVNPVVNEAIFKRTGRVMSEWAVPNWVRNRKDLILGLNVNKALSSTSIAKV